MEQPRAESNPTQGPSRPEAPEALERSELLHRTLASNLPDTFLVLLDRELRIQLISGEGAASLPWFDAEQLIGRRVESLSDMIPAELVEVSLAIYTRALEGEPGEFEFSSAGADFAIKAQPVRGGGGRVESVIVVGRDVTERKRDSEALERHALRQRAIAELGQTALRERDLDTVLRAATKALTEVLDLEFSAVLEYHEDPPRFYLRTCRGWRAGASTPFAPSSHAGYTLRNRSPVVVEDLAEETRFELAPIFTEHGAVSGLSVVIEGRERPFGVLSAHSRERRSYDEHEVDLLTSVANVISAAVERSRDEEASRHAALHDPITGLPNRVLALDRLQYALDRRPREGTEVAVFVVDIDRFKVINESFGHDAGDELLLALASRLRGAVPPEDTVARLGGDEFMVICQNLDGLREVVTIAERLSAAVNRPFVLESGERYVTASIGIAMAGQASDTPDALLRDADVAMFRAKDAGPGRYEVFDSRMRAQVLSRLRVETELREAIDRGELRVYYQPIIDVASAWITSVEALVRWEHPRLGLRFPNEFIPIAEETGLIVDLGAWVLERACRQVALWQQRFGAELGLSVNIAARQLEDPLFALHAAETAHSSGMHADTLSLEVTERTLIDETASPNNCIAALREHGLGLVLDDFGTGYSSLGYLKRFQLDGLKIDRGFVDGLGTEAASPIVEAIVRMSQALGLTVVAEGVETEAQLGKLRELGCDRAQGFLFSRPLPPHELEPLLVQSRAVSVG